MTHPLRNWRRKVGTFTDRRGAKLTLAVLADQLNLVPSALSMIETGDRKPSLSLAAKLSEITGIPMIELATFEKPAHAEAAE